MSPLSAHRRARRAVVLTAVAATAALAFTACAGEPSPVTKAVAHAVAPSATPVSSVVSSIQPATGSVSGGTVTLTGTNLQKVGTVQIGGQPATVTQASADKVVVNVPAAANFQAGSVPVTVTDKTGKPVTTAAGSYDYQVQTPVDKQLAYALTYWKNYNTAEFGDLNPVGGDCANFVSQTLLARGWQMNAQWYNRDAAAKWSPAWGYVPAMDNYFRANAAQLGLTEYSFDQRDKIKVGDIVMFDWNDNDSLDHVQIVSGVQNVNGKIMIKMAGHNEDSDYRDLDQAITVDHPGGVGHFWSLSK
ncbi:amidase domain-containing protein [Leifsonia sp. 2MCAF36]|uniref:amidase domain-containing protein n=1 Tax=Leifsonia sp. 2MCAF36 TaxID=3232988 RepID=UPI003F9C2E25